MIMEGYTIAMRNGDAAAIAKLASTYGKYNKLDKEDEIDRGYGQVPHIRFTFDVSVLGFQPIPNVSKVISDLIARYSKSRLTDFAEDAEVVELTNAANSLTVKPKEQDYGDD